MRQRGRQTKRQADRHKGRQTDRQPDIHEALYRWHILSDRTIIHPGTTPYYDEDFSMTIKGVKEEGLLNVTTMSCSTLYTVLLENNITQSAPIIPLLEPSS